MSGWKLTATLITKQVSKLGDTLAMALANFDPETATEADRDVLREKLSDVALRVAAATRTYDDEKAEADELAALIATDEAAVDVLIKKFEAGVIDEETLNEFAATLEDQKARLPGELQDAADAKELLDTLRGMLATIEKKLADFDRHAKEVARAIAQAKADEERQELRLQHQQELAAMKSGLGDTSTALNALSKKAGQLKDEAAAAKIIADAGQKPLDRANAVAEARLIAAGAAPAAAESAADRLRRIAARK